jgi:hypothetical protein
MDKQHHAVIGQPTPEISYPSPYEPALLHWDGVFFCFLCFGSWMLFAWLWARNHKPKRTLKQRVESPEIFSGKHWRN